ncbi:hypothetical protein [Mycoplasmopsis glycophila]|uniref:Uncharacterized protein n=1 Tax=Mycoplasmopsis glycophila TaxID=171285 RepID=A0A449AW61_9BACT|nr:hypothetical protein [Mycoplasmopsis glycophila]VEU70879.1 Uncharacterised protein [Mycoplasmopsis glycophila]
MKIIWNKIKAKAQIFDFYDWITFTIGFTLLFTYLYFTFFEWYMVSTRAYTGYSEINSIIRDLKQSNYLTRTQEVSLSRVIYPNAVQLFWGGSTYFFTFLTNVYMGVVLVFFQLLVNL